MDYLTPDQIAALCEDITDPRANRRAMFQSAPGFDTGRSTRCRDRYGLRE